MQIQAIVRQADQAAAGRQTKAIQRSFRHSDWEDKFETKRYAASVKEGNANRDCREVVKMKGRNCQAGAGEAASSLKE